MITRATVLLDGEPAGELRVEKDGVARVTTDHEWLREAAKGPCGAADVLAEPADGDLFIAAFAVQFARGRSIGVRLFNERGDELPASYAMTVFGMMAEAME